MDTIGKTIANTPAVAAPRSVSATLWRKNSSRSSGKHDQSNYGRVESFRRGEEAISGFRNSHCEPYARHVEPDKAVSNYSMNFSLGGCDWPNVWDVNDWPPVKDAVVRGPAATVHLTDGGSQSVNTKNPQKCVTPRSPEKPSCWIVHDTANDAPCVGCVTSTGAPNWGGPHLRHNGRSNVAFVDSHVQAMKASQWYWAGTPWLKPALGGD